MKNKTAFIAISITIVAVIAILIFMKKTADDARQTSKDITEGFKKVDESLQQTNDSIKKAADSLLKGTGAVTIDTNVTQ